ncbi:MAG: altronate dehydratase, partial [Clostridium sp.]
IGAEHLLARRAVNAKVANQILEIVTHYEDAMRQVQDDVRKRNPSPGNKAGGITTLEEKSLGCIYKSGHAPIQAVYDYAQPIHHKGLVIMDTPGNDPISITGMVAGGCQLVLFTTGRGTPTGNPIVPVIKLSANRETAAIMKDNLDFDASPLLYGTTTMEKSCAALLQEILQVCDGKLTRSEVLGYYETAIARVGRYVMHDADGTPHVESYYY